MSILADYFLIVSADSARHGSAIAEAIQQEFKQRGLLPLGIEGRPECTWVLLDYGDIVVHIQVADARAFYDLDNYWGDAPSVELKPLVPEHLDQADQRKFA